ncbi:MAG: hypothetical protein N2202_02340 [Proteobacteria bacterium]|nr:hypothetical protein [Pseudomonadota bacterium]
MKKIFIFFFCLIVFVKFSQSQELKAHHNVFTPKVSSDEAIEIVRKNIPMLTVGSVYLSKGKSGIKSLDVPLEIKGKKISIIRLNPQTGEILPKGYRTYYPESKISEDFALKRVEEILPALKVGSPWLGIDKNWKVPLVLDGTVISEVFVNAEKGELVFIK